MTQLRIFLAELHSDESGASFIEYTALLGVILAVAIGILATVGEWAGETWAYLCSTLLDNSAAAVVVTGTCG